MTTTLTSAFDWVWQTSIESSLLIGVVFVLQFLFRDRLSPRLSYLMGLLILLRLVTPIAPPSSFSAFNAIDGLAAPEVLHIGFDEREVSPSAFPAAVHLEPDVPATGGRHDERQSYAANETDWSIIAAAVWSCGAAGLLLLVGRSFLQTTQIVRSGRPVSDAAIQHLFQECKSTIGVRRRVQLLAVLGIGTPAASGWFRPKILIPVEIMDRLATADLRHVLLHELAHVKRHDVLLNWCVILVRAIHWFNPLVWIATRNLRADREIVRDQMVLAKLDPTARTSYGAMLLSLVRQSRHAPLCPSLAGAFHRNTEIRRRIIMITKFKNPRRLAAAGSALVILTLGALTFTGAAADEKSDQAPAAQLPGSYDQFFKNPWKKAPTESGRREGIARLKARLEEHRRLVEEAAAKADRLRVELAISDTESPGQANAELFRKLEYDRQTAQSMAVHYNTMCAQLEKLNKNELKNVLPTVSPDKPLDTVLSNFLTAETSLAAKKSTLGPEHPDIQTLSATIAQLNKQIDDRTSGIMTGLKTMAASYASRAAALAKEIESAKLKDAQFMERSRPYFAAKRQLETHQRILDALQLRILQEEIDAEIEK